MIYEFTYNTRKICWKCIYLKLKDDWFGECICKDNKIKNRHRSVTDKACSYKKLGVE
jgi:hypothetical protein